MNTVGDIRELKIRGPWTTKSNGELRVLQAFPLEVMQKFLHYEEGRECIFGNSDIRGFRTYTVTGLAKGAIGGGEFHEVRQELVFCLTGRIIWSCEDMTGATKVLGLTPSECGVWMPPGILHAYEVLDNGSSLLVIANTLFDPDNLATHDTYPEAQFRALQVKR